MGDLCEIFPLQVTLTFAIDLTTEFINFGSCRNHYFTSFLNQIFIIGTKIYLSEDFQKIMLKTAETANLRAKTTNSLVPEYCIYYCHES